MDRAVVLPVDPVSTTHNVTTSPVPVYRGVVLGTRETSVKKVYQMLICSIINKFCASFQVLFSSLS